MKLRLLSVRTYGPSTVFILAEIYPIVNPDNV